MSIVDGGFGCESKFNSGDYEYQVIENEGNCSRVVVANPSGNNLELCINSDISDPGYKFTLNYQGVVPATDVDNVWTPIHAEYEAQCITLGVPIPEPFAPGEDALINVTLEVESKDGSIGGGGSISFGGYSADITLGGNSGGFAAFTASGDYMPALLTNGTNINKVKGIGLSHNGLNGNKEATALYSDETGTVKSEGIVIRRPGPACHKLSTIPLEFDVGTLIVSLGAVNITDFQQASNKVYDDVMTAVYSALAGALGTGGGGLRKCLWGIIGTIVAGIFCTIGIIASLSGGPAGIVIGILCCIGGKAWGVIDTIRSHLKKT